MRSLGLVTASLVLAGCARPSVDESPTHVDDVETEVGVDAAWVEAGTTFVPRAGALHAAMVSLPARADQAFGVEDPRTGARVEVMLPEADAAVGVMSGDDVVYANALGAGRDLVQRRTAGGVEDYVGAGDATSMTYTIRLVRGIAGLRLVGDTLEMLDASGAPRLRAARPRILDEDGVARKVEVALHGCAYDADTRGPWGRPVVSPGSSTCELELSWNESDGAVWIDPGWEATGSMAIPRVAPMVATLSDDRVLAVGGYRADGAASGSRLGELYDATTGTWASTGSLPGDHWGGTLTALDGGRALLSGPLTATNFAANRAYVFDGAAFVEQVYNLSINGAVRLADGRVLIVGGTNGASTDQLAVFDPGTNGFGNVGVLPFVASNPAVVRVEIGGQEHVIVAGGTDNTQVSGGVSVTISNVAAIDVSNFDVEILPSMPRDRSDFELLPWGDGKLVAIGGARWFNDPSQGNPQGIQARVEVDAYDIAARTWSPLAPSPEPWAAARSVTMIDGSVLTFGGCNIVNGVCDGASAETRRLSLGGAWEPAGILSAPRFLLGGAKLSGDRVLAIGGGVTNTTYPLVDLFSPSQNGEPCTLASECASQQCVEGVCCDTACGGACESCLAAVKGNGTDGTCGVVPRHENPKGACHTAADCTREECDGAGTCAPVLDMCAPYQCAPDMGCLAQCTADAQCQQGFACFGGGCIDATSLCVGSVGKDRTSGQDVECAPYVCTPDGACRTSCADSSQCASGRVCDAESRCVAVDPPEDEEKKTEDEGCTIALRDGSTGSMALLLGAIALAVARRRSQKRAG